MQVYKIANLVNDRVYIGLTTCALSKRWREHKSAANTDVDKPLYRAMRKHGVNNFYIEPIYETQDVQALRDAEMSLIGDYKAHVSDGGYNLTDHGFNYGNQNTAKGEQQAQSLLTEQIVQYIRNPDTASVTNQVLVDEVLSVFGVLASRDCIRDARRGSRWSHLNDKFPPVKIGRGARSELSTDGKIQAVNTLNKYRDAAIVAMRESRAGKRGSHAKLSIAKVKEIFYSPLSLSKTAVEHGISKKMVLLIKQRRAHVYLTKDLP
jgi:group I intron endonuclease